MGQGITPPSFYIFNFSEREGVKKKEMKRILKYLLALTSTCFLILTCGILMEGLPTSLPWWEQFYQLPKHSLKIALYGSSHCYCSFDPEIFEEELGGNVIQLGNNSMDLVPIEYYIRETLIYQKPELIILEGYSFMIDENQIINTRDTAMKGMRWGKARIQGNRAMFGYRASLRKMLPFWDNHGNWENPGYAERRLKYLLNPETVKNSDRYQKAEQTMSEETKIKYKEMEVNPHSWTMEKDQKEAFGRIAELLKENNIELVVVMAPIYEEWRLHVDYEGRHREIKKLTETYDVDFLDYNDKELYNTLGVDETWFRDDLSLDIGNTHLNSYGAEKISKHLSQWIYKNKQ